MNVFFIETPLQLVNAIEAKHSLHLTDNHLLLLVSETYPKTFFQPLLDDDPWDTVEYLTVREGPELGVQGWLRGHPSRRVRSYYETFELRGFRRRLDTLAGRLDHARRLFIGNYFVPHMRHLANVTRHDELVLLDDGTTTLQIAAERRRTGRGSGAVERRWQEGVVRRLIGWNVASAPSATFFTAYDLRAGTGDVVMRHGYEHLRARTAAGSRNEEVMFLGQPLYFEGVSDEVYLDLLRGLVTRFDRDTFVYLPHKAENWTRISCIRDELGLAVRRYDLPIEYQLALRGPRPRILASFFSSALENCRIIFGPELSIEAIYLDPALCPKEPDFVRTVYEYFDSMESDHFRVVKLSAASA